jgi:hypothetical protein
MINEKIVEDIKQYYEKIFKENADNSIEFITFTQGNPHPLRIKVENYIIELENDNKKRNDLLYLLDTLIMDYIELYD